jgi:hypothetical protein
MFPANRCGLMHQFHYKGKKKGFAEQAAAGFGTVWQMPQTESDGFGP